MRPANHQQTVHTHWSRRLRTALEAVYNRSGTPASPFRLNVATRRYTVARPMTERDILDQARQILERRFVRGPLIFDPQIAKEYITLKLAEFEREVFGCLFLDNFERVLGWEELFHGSIYEFYAYPREVAKACLRHNAAAVIFAHNHPSGIPQPSEQDISLTRCLIETLALIDIRVIDHLVVGGCEVVSFAEHRLL